MCDDYFLERSDHFGSKDSIGAKNKSFMKGFFIFVALIMLTSHVSASDKARGAISIGKKRQMFIDDHLIKKMDNITRRLCPVSKHPANPMIKPEYPWERGLTADQGTVIYDGDEKLYKMWYTTNVQGKGEGPTYNRGKSLAYATSEDGIHWEKPMMSIYVENGEKTNIVIGPMTFGYMYQPYFVIKDVDEPDAEKRYKLAFLSIDRHATENETPKYPGTRRGMGIGFSPDGLRWTKVKDYASEDIIDISHFMIDPGQDNKYVVYGRTLYVSPEIEKAWRDYDWFDEIYNGRSVIRTTSRDFINWTPAEFVMGADLKDPPSTMIYSMNVFPYEGVYLGMAQRYISRPDTSTIDIQLAISRDGVNFERPFREAFIPLGGVGTWDRFMVFNVSGPPLEQEDALHFYYGARTSRHNPNTMSDAKYGGAVGLATLLRDRFVSVEASFDGGTLMTQPIVFEGSSLRVNCNTGAGKMRVRITDHLGNGITGYSAIIEGVDSVDHSVEFDQSLQALSSQPVQIEFTLYNAQLYSFSVQ